MIGLIGATGFTGILIAEKLNSQRSAFRIMGRNKEKLAALKSKLGSNCELAVFEVREPSTHSAIDGCSVVINCAGPFTDLGEPVVREAINRGVHYVDTTGEQGFIQLVFERYGQLAKGNGVALVPACAFEYALGETASALVAARMPDCEELEIIYSVKGMHTSIGTRKSIIRAMTAPCLQRAGGTAVNSPIHAMKITTSGNKQDRGRHPDGPLSKEKQSQDDECSVIQFPGGEIFMVPLHSAVSQR